MTEIATQIRDFDSKITSLEVIINHNSELSSRPTSNTGALVPATAPVPTGNCRAVLVGDWLIRPSLPGQQQPHSQQHQNSVSNREIEITFGFCSVRFLPLNWVILQKEKTSYNLILIRMVTSGSGRPRRL